MSEKKKPKAPASSEEVGRIRDIIFGNQMQDYDQRFDVVKRDLGRLQQELDHLGERLVEQDSNQANKLQALRRETRQADDDLRDEFRQSAQKLSNDKVDRDVLGELFIEVGNRLKSGGSVSDLLQTLTEGELE